VKVYILEAEDTIALARNARKFPMEPSRLEKILKELDRVKRVLGMETDGLKYWINHSDTPENLYAAACRVIRTLKPYI
jgi:hypothetical protein